MLGGLLTFLVGVLVLVVVLWGFKLVIDMLNLPGEIKQIVLVLVAVIALVVLVMLALGAFGVISGVPRIVL